MNSWETDYNNPINSNLLQMTIAQKDITKEYSLGIVKIQFEYKRTKKSLLENLEKYMIRAWGDKKEALSSNVDELLYGKK